MDNVVSLVSRLQAACTVLGDTVGDDGPRALPSLWERLPSIVVIGGQSSGKSSVLEAVVGKDFLPRGTGIVTRRPLVLQLVHLEDKDAKEFGEFPHNQGKVYHDFEQIRQEIEDETERALGNKATKAVSPEPIHLTVSSPNVPNLTLVDMPGLTKVPIDGQPATIVQDIEEMVRKYVTVESAVMLAVTPANADLATSDALRLARDVDPSGDRTIGVLTKIDIMDRGTSVRDILEGDTLRLKHGWVGVVNRGQADINSKMSMQDARKREREFFDGSANYRHLDNIGTGFLAEKLSKHLLHEIKKALPSIMASIKQDIITLERECEALGPAVMDSRGQMLHFILKRTADFESAFKSLVDQGKGGGERILSVFERKLHADLHALPFHDILAVENVRRIISEADGLRPHLIAPEAGYRRLLEAGLLLMRDPAQGAVEEVHRILLSVIDKALTSETCAALSKYSMLVSEIQNCAITRLEELKESAHVMVKTLVEMESSYMSANIFRHIMELQSKANSSDEARIALKEFRTLSGKDISDRLMSDQGGQHYLKKIASQVSAYLNFVRRQLLNTVPKAVVHTQVLKAKGGLLEPFQEDVAGREEGELSRLLHEDPDVTRRRNACKRRLELLKKAQDEIASAKF
ncbi:unnamed protein product [Ostreobium quekettii]|uniref:Uncharacterized protein n=1 Tax=Ostreobium quekettii TaxID=121088 RepID=A0A8S1IL92_9CHLO|nr:unnamed protein product [Ostreobium quekettii]|eukprot:evm.model.scf_254EXC.12 EVM.evm.TU.scf_254EXC.12   scf_254EXC:93113-99856(-)